MTIGTNAAAIRVVFGKNINFDILMSNCKRAYLIAYMSGTYVRFENVATGMNVEDIEINPHVYEFTKFVAAYKNVIKTHIYCRTRKY